MISLNDYLPVIKVERPDDPDWNRHVADHVLTAGPHHQSVVIVLVGQVGHGPLHVLLLTQDLATYLNNYGMLLLCTRLFSSIRLVKLKTSRPPNVQQYEQ